MWWKEVRWQGGDPDSRSRQWEWSLGRERAGGEKLVVGGSQRDLEGVGKREVMQRLLEGIGIAVVAEGLAKLGTGRELREGLRTDFGEVERKLGAGGEVDSRQVGRRDCIREGGNMQVECKLVEVLLLEVVLLVELQALEGHFEVLWLLYDGVASLLLWKEEALELWFPPRNRNTRELL